MNISHFAKARYTTKAFDPTRKISADVMDQIETLLRYSPSSTNSQPWHFFIASTDEGKGRIAKATSGLYVFNEAKVRNASHVVVFCTRCAIDDAYLHELLDQEDKDGRFPTPKNRDAQRDGRALFVNLHRFERRDVQHWLEKQVYLAIGTLLIGASGLEIDACPMEGFHQTIMDEELGLRDLGYTSSVIVALGYHSGDDFNSKLPKSRLPSESVITRL